MPCIVKLNAGRNVTGQLRGFDQFMNIVLDNTIEEVSEAEVLSGAGVGGS